MRISVLLALAVLASLPVWADSNCSPGSITANSKLPNNGGPFTATWTFTPFFNLTFGGCGSPIVQSTVSWMTPLVSQTTCSPNPQQSGIPVTCQTPFNVSANTGGTRSGQLFVDFGSPGKISTTIMQLGPPEQLTVSVTGNGSVASSPSGIACPGTCSNTFPLGTSVSLSATPSAGFGFSGWSGACSGTGICTIVMSNAQNVTAGFIPLWETAFQANTSDLYVIGSNGSATNTGLGMMAGTSPSIAKLTNGGWELAFQANTGDLYLLGSNGSITNTGLGMMAGTSPSITGLTNGGYEYAFQANTSGLYVVGSNGTGGNTGLGMMTGTSPSIAGLTNGGWELAFQANTSDLYLVGSNGSITNTGLGMMAGTSPSITALANGGYEYAFQANTSDLYVIGSNGSGGNRGLGMMAGTSPSISFF